MTTVARWEPAGKGRRRIGWGAALLVQAVKDTLRAALAAGGSTLRDFVGSDGKQGYFQHQRTVYDREGEPCRVCATPIKMIRQGQRATFFCPVCQKP